VRLRVDSDHRHRRSEGDVGSSGRSAELKVL
jgi:hypothetical protein